MHELLYLSTAQKDLPKDEILNILEVSRKANKELHITGILLYSRRTDRFAQVLEGEKKIIFDLFNNKICKDDRHYDIKLVHDDPISHRRVKDWSMAFKNLDEIDVTQLEGYSEFANVGFKKELNKIVPSIAVLLIDSFRKSLS